jgi:predicted peptidase
VTQQPQSFDRQITKTVHLQYLLHLPPGYHKGRRWPLILFLHGMGERGDDLELVKLHGIPRVAEEKPELLARFIAISPQCPLGTYWTHQQEALYGLLDHALEQYDIDPNRIYLTGLSMGGFGAWFLGLSCPERFAAMVPICGGGEPYGAVLLKDVPIWVFHGAKDRIVPPAESRRMVRALRAVGGNVRLTIYPEADHDSWTDTYNNPGLYDWLLQHQLPR